MYRPRPNLLKLAFETLGELLCPTPKLPKHHKGLFIVVEGGDGSGKTGVMKFLEERLPEQYPNLNFHFTREVGGTDTGECIRTVLLECKLNPDAQMLLASAARLEHQFKLDSLLSCETNVVICDRYHFSTIAYQCAAGGASYQMEEAIRKHYEFIKPDNVLFLDAGESGYDRFKGRSATDQFEMRERDFHRATVASYRAQSKGLLVDSHTVNAEVGIGYTNGLSYDYISECVSDHAAFISLAHGNP